jgi:hypothetical protein
LMIAGLVLISITPWISAPLLVWNDLDPMAFIHHSHNSMKQSWNATALQIVANILLYTFRTVIVVFSLVETERAVAFFLVPGGFSVLIRLFTVDALVYKATKGITSYVLFQRDYMIYKRLLVLMRAIVYCVGQVVFIFLGLVMILAVILGYINIVFHGTISLPLFFVILSVYVSLLWVTSWGIQNEVYPYESSLRLVHLWYRSSLKMMCNRKLMRKKLKGLTPLKFYGQAADVNLFFFNRSMVVTYFGTIIIHTANVVLSFPHNKHK